VVGCGDCRQIRDEAGNNEDTHGELVVYPLYSSLPPQAQQKIFSVRGGAGQGGKTPYLGTHPS
jgi:HrpA-like RNA helicase